MIRPLLMGIVNCTPDSFSGDGVVSPAEVIHRTDAQLAAGVDIIDLGAESTRPGAHALTDDEEWARLAPVLQALAAHTQRAQFRLSLDSYHPATVARALPFIDIVNDVTGFRDAAMLQTLRGWAGDVVAMHALSVPVNPAETLDPSCDVVAEILRWKQEILARAMAAGIAPERLIFDPGIGFGKTAAQSFTLIARARELVQSGGHWLVGHSRKSFLKALGDDRDASTLALSAVLAQSGVQMLRVHEVARHRALVDAVCT